MDALTHNIESYLSPPTTRCATALRWKGRASPRARWWRPCSEPGNLQARSDMMMSSMMGAIAFQKDLGAVHRRAHALGAVCDLHHGLANALMIDTVLAWNTKPRRRSSRSWRTCARSGGGGLRPVLKALKRSQPASRHALDTA
jgi:alcohol dehydrogenase class IV